eukprot:8891477-Pyramimonas_sp.AAC.1
MPWWEPADAEVSVGFHLPGRGERCGFVGAGAAGDAGSAWRSLDLVGHPNTTSLARGHGFDHPP